MLRRLTTWGLAALLLALPYFATAQTVNSRTHDSLGNGIESATGAPGGSARGLVTRPAGTADVNCVSGCATPNDTTATGTLNALNAAVSIALGGQRGAVFSIASGTLDADVVVEVSQDNQSTWVAASFGDPTTGLVTTTLNLDNPNTATSRVILFPGAISHARVRVSGFISGSASASLRATTVNPGVMAYGSDLAGSGLQPLPMLNSTPAGTEMAPVFRCIGCTSTGGTSAADNTTWVYGTTAVTPSGYIYHTTPTAPTNGRVGAARMDVNRNVQMSPVDSAGVAMGESATNALRVTPVTVVSVQNYNRRATTTFSATGSLAIDATGAGSIMWEVDAGLSASTIVFEGTLDDSNWFALQGVELGGATTQSGRIVSSLTSFGRRGWFRQTGYKQVRLRVSTYGSGSSAARIEVSMAPSGIDPTRVNCSRTAIVNTATGITPVQLVAGVTGEHIYICGIDVSADGTTTVDLVEGTSSSCASAAAISATHRLTAQAGWVRESPNQPVYKTSTAGNFVCLRTGSNIQTDVTIRFEQF